MKGKISLDKYEKFYKANYKKFLVFPIVLLLLSFVFIFIATQEDGTPIYRDISLKGGLSAIITIDTEITSQDYLDYLNSEYPSNSFKVSELFQEGERSGFIVDTDLDEEIFKQSSEEFLGSSLELGNNYVSNFISPTLSNSFFQQAIIILVISLLFMSAVIFIYFKEFIPSLAVVLSAVFDLIVTIGVLNLLKFEISVAGIGALLMIIGYSIDTDVLLTNRLIKERGDNYFEKAFDAFKTGSLMTVTTLSAGIVAMILTNSAVIFEIALILVIGLIVDYISTWVQNSSIILWWLNSKK